jgi:hypothetical protein
MARTKARLRTSAAIWAIGSPASVEPKSKTAKSAISAATTRRQPQPVIGSVGS